MRQLLHQDRQALLALLAFVHLGAQPLGGKLQLQGTVGDPLLQLCVGLGEFVAHLEQVDERLHFRAQNLRDDRGQDVVDRAQGVALHRLHVVGEGGDEDDGRVARFPTLPDERRGFVARHSRHVHIEQDDREFALEQQLQRVLARRHADHILAEVAERDPIGEVLLGQVVHDQNVGAARGRGIAHGIPVLDGAGVSDRARSAERRAGGANPRAWTDSPRRLLRCSARDRLSWLWP